MPILHIRNVPDELYERVRKRAAAERRSLTAEVIDLLEAGLNATRSQDDIDDLLERARVFRERLRARGFSFDVTAAIREDRER